MFPQNHQVIDIKPVKCSALTSTLKTRGEKMKVSLAMLLKTNRDKMSVYRLLAILMKTNELKWLSGDVDDN
jgi:hypothetical protein